MRHLQNASNPCYINSATTLSVEVPVPDVDNLGRRDGWLITLWNSVASSAVFRPIGLVWYFSRGKNLLSAGCSFFGLLSFFSAIFLAGFGLLVVCIQCQISTISEIIYIQTGPVSTLSTTCCYVMTVSPISGSPSDNFIRNLFKWETLMQDKAI